jgi:hypothetical protein
MNLCWGVILGTVFLFLALFVAFSQNTHEPTLSEAFQDTATLQGKLFVVSLIIPSIAFWVSGYYWKLENVRCRDSGSMRVDWWCRFLRILSNICFIIVALVPHIENHELKMENTSDGKQELARAFTKVHLICGILCFGAFAFSEVLTIRYKKEPHTAALWWRSFACSLLLSTMVMFEVNNLTLLDDNISERTELVARHWSFRWEVLIGAGFCWATQVTWHFSDPLFLNAANMDAEFDAGSTFRRLFPYPYLSAMIVIFADMMRTGINVDSLTAAFIELLMFAGLVAIIGEVVITNVHGKLSWPSSYGTCESKKAEEACS